MSENTGGSVISTECSNVLEVENFLKSRTSLSIKYNKDLKEKEDAFVRSSKGCFKIDKENFSKPLEVGMSFFTVINKKDKGKYWSLRKVVGFSNDEDISDLEYESAVDFNMGIGSIKFKNSSSKSYYGFIKSNKPYLFGVFLENTGQKVVKLDYGLEFELDDAWGVTSRSLDEIIQFLSEQCEKGFLSPKLFDSFIKLNCEIDGEYISKYNDSYLKNAIVKPIIDNDFFQSFEVSLSDVSSLKFNITDKEKRIVYADIDVAKLLKLKAVVAPYYLKYGKLIYDLEDLAKALSANYYPQYLKALFAALNLPETTQIYVDRLNDLNNAIFYIKKDECADLEPLALTFRYTLYSTSGRTGYTFKNYSEFLKVYDQARRWVGYYLDIDLQYKKHSCDVLTVSRSEVYESVIKIFN